jgi:hypothetical protein
MHAKMSFSLNPFGIEDGFFIILVLMSLLCFALIAFGIAVFCTNWIQSKEEYGKMISFSDDKHKVDIDLPEFDDDDDDESTEFDQAEKNKLLMIEASP